MIDGWFQSRRTMRPTLSTEMSCHGSVANMLPAGNLLEHQQPDLVARVQKMPRLRIMRRPHNVALQILAQNQRILPLHPRRHRLSHTRKSLVPIEAAQLDDLAIQLEALGVNCASRKPIRRVSSSSSRPSLQQPHFHA